MNTFRRSNMLTGLNSQSVTHKEVMATLNALDQINLKENPDYLKERNAFAEVLNDPSNQVDRKKQMEMQLNKAAQADYANTFEGKIKIVDYVPPVHKEKILQEDPSTSALSDQEPPLVSNKRLKETSFAGTDLKMSNEERLKAKNKVLSKFQDIIQSADTRRKENFTDDQ